jgi:hypothetical protein
VQHDDDVRAELERFPVTGLLIPSVSAVRRVNDDVPDPQLLGAAHGVVAARVIDEITSSTTSAESPASLLDVFSAL